MYNVAGHYTYLIETESWAGAAREGSHTSLNTIRILQCRISLISLERNQIHSLFFILTATVQKTKCC